MNFFNILDQLSEVDADVLGRFDSRRAVFSSLGTLAQRTALATTPLFLSGLFQKAYAGTASTALEVLQYALTLELFEQDFYAKVKASMPYAGASAADRAAIDQIKAHEDAHVVLLRTAITGLGGTPVASAPFKQAEFNKLTTFNGPFTGSMPTSQLGMAQLLEDTGVRAYKGRAAELLGTTLLTTALQIHSVEARHAAKIRLMRGQKPWVNPGDDLAAHPVYTSGVTGPTSTTTPFGYGIPAYDSAKPSSREDNTIQANMPITTALLTAPATYSVAEAAASFDEALQAAEVIDASRAGGLIGA